MLLFLGVTTFALLAFAAGGVGPLLDGSGGVVDDDRSAGVPTPTGEFTPVPTTTPVASDAAASAETGRVDNPWDRRRVVVAVGHNAIPSRNVTRAVRRAIVYWEHHAAFASYPFDFVLRPDASDPDVVVDYNVSVACDGRDEASGCAPLLEAGDTPPDPVTVEIEADLGNGLRSDTVITAHEFGHVLGLDHCDDPTWLMAQGCPNVTDRPDATEREFPFRNTTVTVYVDYANVTAENRSATTRHVRAAMRFYARGGNGTVPENLTFRRVEEPYAADVLLVWKPGGTGGNTIAWSFVGDDVDGDGRSERYTHATGVIDTVPVSHRGYFVGWLLGEILTPDDLPPEFAGTVDDVPWADDRNPAVRPLERRAVG